MQEFSWQEFSWQPYILLQVPVVARGHSSFSLYPWAGWTDCGPWGRTDHGEGLTMKKCTHLVVSLAVAARGEFANMWSQGVFVPS